jgi:multidrug resistance efflux pump
MTEDKNAYEKWAEGKIEEINAKIEQFKAKVKQADADARLNAEQRISDFKQQKEDVQRRLMDLKNAGADAFEEVRSGTQKALNDLKGALDQAVSKLKQ